jgi:hypothetical protein
MSNELNDHLRAALRPVDPGESFTLKVMARIGSEPPAPDRTPSTMGMRLARTAAVATIVMAAVLIAHEWRAQRVEDGLEARRQVMEALRVTSEKLDLAYRAVKDTEHSGAKS